MVLFHLNKKGEWDVITATEKKENLSPKEQEKVLYMDGKLVKKIDFATKQQNKDNDVSGIGVGEEGSGKSTLLGNIMRYKTKDLFDPTKDMIGSDYEDAINKIENVKKKGNLFFDEAVTFLLSTEVMKKESRDLHKIFSIIRQKNLFCLFAIPSFFRLNSYFAMDRSRFLVRTYLKNGNRSYFEYWGDRRKNKLYRVGKQGYNYQSVKPNFRGRFQQCYSLENEEYKKFKEKTLQDEINSIKVKRKKIPTITEVKKAFVEKMIINNTTNSTKELADYWKLTQRHVQHLRQKARERDILQQIPA